MGQGAGGRGAGGAGEDEGDEGDEGAGGQGGIIEQVSPLSPPLFLVSLVSSSCPMPHSPFPTCYQNNFPVQVINEMMN